MIQYTYHSDPTSVADLLTSHLLRLYKLSSSRPYTIALSGGSTARTLTDYWLRHPHLLADKKVAFFWVDERLVPISSEQSNFGNAFRSYFAHSDLSKGDCLYPIPYQPELSAAETAKRYEEKVLAFGREHGRTKLFDTIILGMGEDGHTSSLFPGAALPSTDDRYIGVKHPIDGTERVALTYKGISESSSIFVHLLGASKRVMLETILNQVKAGNESSDTLPLARALLRSKSIPTTIFTDIAP